MMTRLTSYRLALPRRMLVTWMSKEPLLLFSSTLTETTYTETVLTTLPTVLAVK